MNNTALVAAGWIATLAVAFFAGSRLSSTPADTEIIEDADVEQLREENTRLKQELQDRGPTLSAGPGAPGSSSTIPVDGEGEPRVKARGPMPKPLSFEGVTDPSLAVKMLQEYALKMWARGPEGHLQLLKAFSDLMESKQLETIFRDEQTALVQLYPMVKFLVNNDRHVADMTESIYEKMANDPQGFPEVDDNAIEIFADDGIGPILPGLVSKERLARIRGYAKKILETPEASQPSAIRKSRNDIARALRYWQPPMNPDEALAKLQSGDYTPEELRALVSKLGPEHMAKLDLGRTIGPMLATGDYGAISLLSRMSLDSRQIDEMDRYFLEAAKAGRVHAWTIAHYLRSTKRNKWEQARPLVEAGLEQGGKSLFGFSSSLTQLPERPGKDWVSWALGRYDFTDAQTSTLKRTFGIQ